MVEVLCCCTPENVMGEVSLQEGVEAGLKLRATTDEYGNDGVAFEHDAGKLPLIARGKKGRKTWKD